MENTTEGFSDFAEALAQIEARIAAGPSLGYLDHDKKVVRCGMADLIRQYNRDARGIIANRRVARDYVRGQYVVSTVFLGLDHGYGGTPLWFETMVFRGPGNDLYMDRYETYEEALDGHNLIVDELRLRVNWARWFGYSQSHIRKCVRQQKVYP